MNFKRLEEIVIWKNAVSLDKKMVSAFFPLLIENGEFEILKQMVRSSGSIADNIAEGHGRGGNREFLQFLSIARGSAYELRSQLYRCSYRKIDHEILKELNSDTKALISKIDNLISHLRASSRKGQKFDAIEKKSPTTASKQKG